MTKKVTGKAFDFKLFMRLMSYLKNYKLQFFIAFLSAVVLSLAAAARPWLVQQIVDRFITNKDAQQLLFFILIMLSVLLTEVLLQGVFIYEANWLGQHIIKNIRIQIFKHMLSFKMSYFSKYSVGQLVTRVVSDIETIASVFGQGLFMIISDLLKMLVIIVVMLLMSWRLSIIVLTVLPLVLYATKIFQLKIKSAFQEVRNQISNLNGFVQERISGMKIVQLFSREKIEYEKFKAINEKHKKAHIKTVWYYSIFFPIVEMITSISLGIVVWYGGLDAATTGSITIGEIMGFIMMSQMLFRPLNQIADKFNTLQMGMVAAERVFVIIDENEEEIDAGKISLPVLEGTISFKNVHFSYVPHEEVLKGISFDVKKGETVAIVGATGAGKSTIINLLNKLYTINSGVICIDNININELTLPTLRQNIAVVLQDVFLFSDSILNNITLNNKEITFDEVKTAAENIGLKSFINQLPQGYNYNVKERGAMLSSGQRQLISFLRAYVRNPSILVLDEATSSIDMHTEKLIQKATNKITKGRTSIIIAHRLSTIKKADRIIVMEKGAIVEQGSHKELIAKKGYYSKLYEIQFANSIAS